MLGVKYKRIMSTIVALATPHGKSAIAVVRLSGNKALEITRRLTRDDDFKPKPRYATLRKIYDPHTGDLIDEVILTYFKSPNSFTGEDVVEISCHGSPIVIRQILDACLKLDARMASPGEFSLRALHNGKISLSQAEAIRDLIESQTLNAARQSLRQMQGELSNILQPLKDKLLEVIVLLESALEFVEDDLPEYETMQIRASLEEIIDRLLQIGSTFKTGKLLRQGLKVAFVGRPNVGKSSLFNALIGYERAIVTDIAGTTRDSLHESFSIEGIPISLIDTAGLRETQDIVESIGVQRTKMAIADADLVIVVFDSSQQITEEDMQILSEVKSVPHLIAVNKIDIKKYELDGEIKEETVVRVAAKTGEGLDVLKKAIIQPFLTNSSEGEGFLITDARHADLINRAILEIRESIGLLDKKVSEEMVLVGLHNALRLLGQITGEVTTEDILTKIFSTFCIGK